MSWSSSGGGGAFPALQLLARLQAQRSGAPNARRPVDWARLVRETPARVVQNAQLARGVVGPSPVVPPDVRLPPMRFPIPPGMETTLLPPPFSPLATAGWLTGVLAGPQKSEFKSDDPPYPPSAGWDGEDAGKAPKQCLVQRDLDQERCRDLPESNSVAARERRRCCWQSLNARWGECTHTNGEVGHPRLRTRWSKERGCF